MKSVVMEYTNASGQRVNFDSHSEEFNILYSAKSPQLVDCPPKWSPPAANFIKINFGVHFISATSQSVSGALARDSLGRIVAACAYPHDWIADSFIAEAKACKVAVLFAIDLDLSKVHVEGDSLAVIKKLKSEIEDKSILQPIVRDINSTRGSFEVITFSHVGRRSNATAHFLVRVGLQAGQPQFWFGKAPMMVEQAVRRDLA
ncbi:hypothetical protein V6N13_071821 [Hibiscus sabdariffa]